MRTVRVLMCLVVLLVSAASTVGDDHGVVADRSVDPASLSGLEGLSPTDLWEQIDGLAYWAVPLSVPAGYYESADDSSAAALRRSLHEIIDNHRVFPYSHRTKPGEGNHVVDTWDIIALADAHPENPGRVLDIYLNGTFERQLKGTDRDPRYDREHSWPKSLGFPDATTRNAAYSDCHHLYAAYRSYNASRSNKPYGDAEEDPGRRKSTLENLGRGGGLTDEPESSNYSFRDVWQTWIGRRGDVARAMFYMDVRYEGGQRSGVGEPDLQLTSEINDVSQRDVWEASGVAFMGLLPALLDWHLEDLVDDLERRRNTIVYLFQGNRNPFIDHPEWVEVIFGDGGGGSHPSGIAWINEFHYDNVGTDTGEFVEIAGTTGLNLMGWTLIGYNGNGGRAYRAVSLTGIISDQEAGFGVRVFDFVPLQNGPSDGLALVDPAGNVVQLISYEGRFTATDNLADGMDANDIGFSESGNTPVGRSLQLTGHGCCADDFRWSAPAPATRGEPNSGQTFAPCD